MLVPALLIFLLPSLLKDRFYGMRCLTLEVPVLVQHATIRQHPSHWWVNLQGTWSLKYNNQKSCIEATIKCTTMGVLSYPSLAKDIPPHYSTKPQRDCGIAQNRISNWQLMLTGENFIIATLDLVQISVGWTVLPRIPLVVSPNTSAQAFQNWTCKMDYTYTITLTFDLIALHSKGRFSNVATCKR